MIDKIKEIFENSISTKEQFCADGTNLKSIAEASSAIIECYRNGGKVLIFGNGGSAADGQHMAAELVVRFESERKGLPCIALTTDTSILTATSNDYGFNRVFSRQIEALARPGDIVIAISTSGNSENVLEGVREARNKKIPVIAFTGAGGGKLDKDADISISVNSKNTARIQEVHNTVIHVICKIVEDAVNNDNG